MGRRRISPAACVGEVVGLDTGGGVCRVDGMGCVSFGGFAEGAAVWVPFAGGSVGGEEAGGEV